MTIITSVSKSDKAVASFVPPNKPSNQIVSKDRDKEGDLDKSEKESLVSSLSKQLLRLDKKDREQLIYSLFSSDIEKIILDEKRKVSIESEKELNKIINQKTLALDEVYQSDLSAKLVELEQTILLFSQGELNILLEDEKQLVELVFSSVLMLLGQCLADEATIVSIIASLSKELIGSTAPILELHSSQYNLIKNSNIDQDLLSKFNLVERETLLPGSYRLLLDNGSVEASLEENLELLKITLINNYSGVQ